MSRLIVRDKDHAGEIETNMPSVSCGVCGASAQIPAASLGVKHWDALYGGSRKKHGDKLPAFYSDAQWEHDRELEAWSQEHAETHAQAEHEEYARSLRS